MNATQLKTTIRAAIDSSFPLLIKGAPGIGKSDIVAEACQDAQMPLVIRHPVIEESVDYKGLPAIQGAIADFLPFADFHQMLLADKPLAVFFDDLGQAPASVQAALMQVILAREIGGKKISPHVRFIAATNSRKDNAGVANLITPLVSRFTVIELAADANAWRKWAMSNNMPVEIVAFLGFKPMLISTFDPSKQRDITPYACPRSIAQLGKWINAGVTDYEVWQGAVGEAFAVEFKAFYDTFKALAGLPDKVIMTPDSAPIPDKPDVLYALSGALAYRAKDVNFSAIATYAKRLADSGRKEFESCLIHDCTTRHPELLETQAFIEWSVRNQDLI